MTCGALVATLLKHRARALLPRSLAWYAAAAEPLVPLAAMPTQKEARERAPATSSQAEADKALVDAVKMSEKMSPVAGLDALTKALDSAREGGIASSSAIQDARRAGDTILARMQTAEVVPKVLQLSGELLAGATPEQAACLGVYHLEKNKWVNNSPVWLQACSSPSDVTMRRCILRIPGVDSWAVICATASFRVTSSAGPTPEVMLRLLAPELLNPCYSTTKLWQTLANGLWVNQPRLRCSDQSTTSKGPS